MTKTVSLCSAQAAFIDALKNGPNAFPHGLFAGPPERVLLGLKVHANTISHARLVALEDTYPLVKQRIGSECFNILSRRFVEQSHVLDRSLPNLGMDFADFLEAQGLLATTVDLARIEWAWLKAYHAADAEPLMIADLAGLAVATLLEMRITLHPAAQLVQLHDLLAEELPELLAHRSCDAVLVVRPAAQVRLVPLGPVRHALAQSAVKSVPLGNLLAQVDEQGDSEGALAHCIELIEAGAFIRSPA